eukprot:11189472-Lingulodinium_polyedra.AAC.1
MLAAPGVPWVLAADWNVEPQELAALGLLERHAAVVVHSGSPATSGSTPRNLDYFVCSKQAGGPHREGLAGAEALPQ